MVHGWKVNVWCVQNHKTKYPKYHVNNAITVINTGFFCKLVTVTIHVIFARQCQKLTDTTWGEKIVCWVFWQMPTAFNTGHAPSPPLPGARSQKEFKLNAYFLPSSSGTSNFGSKMNTKVPACRMILFIDQAVKTCLERAKTRRRSAFKELSELWMEHKCPAQNSTFSSEFLISEIFVTTPYKSSHLTQKGTFLLVVLVDI